MPVDVRRLSEYAIKCHQISVDISRLSVGPPGVQGAVSPSHLWLAASGRNWGLSVGGWQLGEEHVDSQAGRGLTLRLSIVE